MRCLKLLRTLARTHWCQQKIWRFRSAFLNLYHIPFCSQRVVATFSILSCSLILRFRTVCRVRQTSCTLNHFLSIFLTSYRRVSYVDLRRIYRFPWAGKKLARYPLSRPFSVNFICTCSIRWRNRKLLSRDQQMSRPNVLQVEAKRVVDDATVCGF